MAERGIHQRVSGTVKEGKLIYVNDGGTVKFVEKVYQNVAGAVTKVHGPDEPPPIYQTLVTVTGDWTHTDSKAGGSWIGFALNINGSNGIAGIPGYYGGGRSPTTVDGVTLIQAVAFINPLGEYYFDLVLSGNHSVTSQFKRLYLPGQGWFELGVDGDSPWFQEGGTDGHTGWDFIPLTGYPTNWDLLAENNTGPREFTLEWIGGT